MQYCPPFPTNFDVYLYLLDFIACMTPFINIFTIYCIITKSSKQMAGYRWQLLVHQLLAGLVDILVSILTKPILLLPLPLGYPTGLISKFTSFPPHAQLILALETLICSLVAALQLFFYRYVIASGRSFFSNLQLLFIFIMYLVFSWPAMSFLVIYEDQTKLIQQLRESYSCVSEEVICLPNLQAYSAGTVIRAFSIPMLFAAVLFIIIAVSLIYATHRCLRKTTISKRSVFIQKQFLRQLILQVAVPIAVVIIPAIAVLVVISFQIFGTAMLSLFMLAAISTYGASGALLLIYLTPNYRRSLFLWRASDTTAQVQPALTSTWARQDSKPSQGIK